MGIAMLLKLLLAVGPIERRAVFAVWTSRMATRLCQTAMRSEARGLHPPKETKRLTEKRYSNENLAWASH